MTGSLIERVRERLASESGPLRPSVVAAAIRAESGGMLGDTEVLANLRVLQTELTGAGILEPLLSADGTTDVLVTAPDSVWVDDGNGLRRSQIRFADESAVRRLAQRLALAAGRRLDDAQPWVDGQLTGIGVGGFAVRLHAVLPPVATRALACRCGCCVPRLRIWPRWLRRARSTPRPPRWSPTSCHRPAGIPRVRRNRCREGNVAGSDVGRQCRP
ncbi:ATPase, T2SS/T4P/T4SS family [Mycobacterium tuberculosis]